MWTAAVQIFNEDMIVAVIIAIIAIGFICSSLNCNYHCHDHIVFFENLKLWKLCRTTSYWQSIEMVIIKYLTKLTDPPEMFLIHYLIILCHCNPFPQVFSFWSLENEKSLGARLSNEKYLSFHMHGSYLKNSLLPATSWRLSGPPGRLLSS